MLLLATCKESGKPARGRPLFFRKCWCHFPSWFPRKKECPQPSLPFIFSSNCPTLSSSLTHWPRWSRWHWWKLCSFSVALTSQSVFLSMWAPRHPERIFIYFILSGSEKIKRSRRQWKTSALKACLSYHSFHQRSQTPKGPISHIESPWHTLVTDGSGLAKFSVVRTMVKDDGGRKTVSK